MAMLPEARRVACLSESGDRGHTGDFEGLFSRPGEAVGRKEKHPVGCFVAL